MLAKLSFKNGAEIYGVYWPYMIDGRYYWSLVDIDDTDDVIFSNGVGFSEPKNAQENFEKYGEYYIPKVGGSVDD